MQMKRIQDNLGPHANVAPWSSSQRVAKDALEMAHRYELSESDDGFDPHDTSYIPGDLMAEPDFDAIESGDALSPTQIASIELSRKIRAMRGRPVVSAKR